MPDLTTYAVALIPLAIAGLLIWLYLRKAGGAAAREEEKRAVYQGVVKKDWVATGRIDFATQDDAGADDPERPAEFRLLVEERRIVESIAGNENLEIQWRLATLKEAKVVTAHYHKHLAEHALIRSVAEETPAARSGGRRAGSGAPRRCRRSRRRRRSRPRPRRRASRPAEPHVRVVAGGIRRVGEIAFAPSPRGQPRDRRFSPTRTSGARFARRLQKKSRPVGRLSSLRSDERGAHSRRSRRSGS